MQGPDVYPGAAGRRRTVRTPDKGKHPDATPTPADEAAACNMPPGDAAYSPDAALSRAIPDFTDLFMHAPVGYVLLDNDGRIQAINRTCADLLGWSPDWLTGKPIVRWIASQDRKLFQIHQQKLKTAAGGVRQELLVKNRQGRLISVRLESQREQDRNGATRGCRTIVIDISCEQQSARHLRRLQSQFMHVTRLHTAGELASTLAHELNQPIGTVVLNCEASLRLLSSGADTDPECVDALSQAAAAAKYASDIIRHLRGFLRKNGDSYRDCKLTAVLGDVLTLIEAEARDNDIELELDVARDIPPIYADSVQIEQVLVNLVHNSVEAMSDDSCHAPKKVVIRARREGNEQILVSIDDTGPGLTTRQLKDIFTPFYTTKNAGMGMGLSISRTIIESHGGSLWAATDMENGASFQFTLPASATRRYVA